MEEGPPGPEWQLHMPAGTAVLFAAFTQTGLARLGAEQTHGELSPELSTETLLSDLPCCAPGCAPATATAETGCGAAWDRSPMQ
jgi:hypothetical protein